MATYTEYSQASSVDSYRNTPNQNISTGRQNSAEAHVSFNHKNKEEEKDKRQKYLTAKYGQHQMMLIRKRLAVEDWLYDKLRELYDCQDDSDDHDCKLDLEDVLNLDTDVERREYAQRELVNAQVSREEVERFIDELIKKSKTL
ncbi:uncharacterized protein LOC128177473 [Crassostrea angulata]|uniref:protein phosphatase 1 regulatory subunit 14C n=1 Tax=Magallana gigas TaxID=29159 RepID=UPI0005C36E02|nr:uncharacterized protein LOC128177473 [Crassostrea angulata]|eukprot:XP_011418994.1 PREDICTED: uncharacterized protein LOC105322152 [Crassostrea gigas]